jgi:hypothetical protein
MDDFEREACRRLPLAEAALRVLDYVSNDVLLSSVFRQYRGASYEKVIGFPLFVHLIADSLLGHEASGHQSFQRAKEDGSLNASVRALYGKLARVPIGLSRGFLTETTRRLYEIFPAVPATVLPQSLRGFTVLAMDGKKLKHVAKRLKALRKVKGNVLGGKLVVAQNVATGLAIALDGHPDGEVSDAPLVPGVVEQVHAVVPRSRLWMSDRQFCDLNQPRLQSTNGDHWLIRYNAKVGFHADPARPQRYGKDRQGRTYKEEWGWLGKENNPRRQYVRRITLQRPQDEDIILVTDLLDEEQFPATDLLEAYLLRWGIERMFQQVTEVFNLRELIGGTPEATVFQAAFCFLVYNVIIVLRAYLSVAQDKEPEKISSENLFTDVQRQLIAWQEMIGPLKTQKVLGSTLSAAGLGRKLTRLLKTEWSDRWLKAPPRKVTPKHPEKEYLKGGHNSVFRLLQEARKTKKKVDAHSRK